MQVAAAAGVTVDLWQWSLAGSPGQMRRWHALLSGDEIARAQRFVRPADAAAFVVARGRLREVLGGVTGIAPHNLRFDYGAHGRPSLRGAGMPLFNLSHSGGRAALALSDHVQPGIDIEKLRPIERGVARRHFSPAERAALEPLTGDAWTEAFFRCWTRKEAIVKAHGDGLTLPLAAFDVSLDTAPPRVLRMTFDNAAAWRLHSFHPAPGHVGAIALRNGGQAIRVRPRHLPDEDKPPH